MFPVPVATPFPPFPPPPPLQPTTAAAARPAPPKAAEPSKRRRLIRFRQKLFQYLESAIVVSFRPSPAAIASRNYEGYQPTRKRGSNTSRSASPARLKPSTARTMAPPAARV